MLIKNIGEFKRVKTISVNKNTCYILIEAGFKTVNIDGDKYFFIKTDNLCKFLKSKGVSVD